MVIQHCLYIHTYINAEYLTVFRDLKPHNKLVNLNTWQLLKLYEIVVIQHCLDPNIHHTVFGSGPESLRMVAFTVLDKKTNLSFKKNYLSKKYKTLYFTRFAQFQY